VADLPGNEANATLAAFLRAGALRASSDWSRDDPRLDGWELRCHPDLVERLEAASSTPATFVFGLPVLVHANGIAYAAASGTSLVLVRLPAESRADLVRSQWGVPFVDREWVDVEPWLDSPAAEPVGRMRRWLERASEYAASLGQGPSR
jgi:hypothetical protein